MFGSAGDFRVAWTFIDIMNSDDLAAATAAAARVRDPRLVTYHDPDHLLGRAMARRLGWRCHVAWDTYFAYRPGVLWLGVDPPTPEVWFHQLKDRELWARTAELEVGDASWTRHLAETCEADPAQFRTGDDLRISLAEALVALMRPADMVRRRVLLVAPATSYNAAAFIDAAARLDLDVVLASDRCHQLDELFAFPPASLVIDLAAPEAAVEVIVAESRRHDAAPIVAAIAAGGESAALIATMAAQALGLPHNAIGAVQAARDKQRMRELLAAAGVPQPRFCGTDLEEPSGSVATRIRAELGFPCVIKPRLLSASRGVIRVDDDLSLARGLARLRALLARPDHLEMDLYGDGSSRSILIEEFVPGAEVALEGVLVRGALQTLALFDKPDPLEGPYFEETIYVTPSRHPIALQRAIEQVTAAAAHAMGLRDGPVHAELRLPPRGPVVIEVAARSIGGLCSRMLRFGTGLSLEDVLVRHALGHDIGALPREHVAAGAMMIPIPRAGVLKAVDGVDLARAVPGIDDVVISQDLDRQLVPLPEGASYLGFLFAHGPTPVAVEASLRAAHEALRFTIVPMLPVR